MRPYTLNAWGRPPTCMRPYTCVAWGRTLTLHEAVHEPFYFPHFLLFLKYLEPKAVCIWKHIVRKEFRSWIHYHKQWKLAFIALERSCYKRTWVISRVRLYPVVLLVYHAIIAHIPTKQRNFEILKLLQIYKNDQNSKFMLRYMLFKIFLRQLHKMVRK